MVQPHAHSHVNTHPGARTIMRFAWLCARQGVFLEFPSWKLSAKDILEPTLALEGPGSLACLKSIVNTSRRVGREEERRKSRRSEVYVHFGDRTVQP